MSKTFLYVPDIHLFGSYYHGAVAVNLHDDDTLTALQTLVDGYVESVHVNPIDIWVNEEGLFRPDFVPNKIASNIANVRLVGPAVITGIDVNTGETLGLSQKQIDALAKVFYLNYAGDTYMLDEIVSVNLELREALTC